MHTEHSVVRKRCIAENLYALGSPKIDDREPGRYLGTPLSRPFRSPKNHMGYPGNPVRWSWAETKALNRPRNRSNSILLLTNWHPENPNVYGCPGLRHGRHLCLRETQSGMPASHPRQPGERQFENRMIRGPNPTASFTTSGENGERERVWGGQRPDSQGWFWSRSQRFQKGESASLGRPPKPGRPCGQREPRWLSPPGLRSPLSAAYARGL